MHGWVYDLGGERGRADLLLLFVGRSVCGGVADLVSRISRSGPAYTGEQGRQGAGGITHPPWSRPSLPLFFFLKSEMVESFHLFCFGFLENVSVPHGHLQCTVAQDVGNNSDINPTGQKVACGGMADIVDFYVDSP